MTKLSLALAITLVSSACSAQETATEPLDEAGIFAAAGFTRQADGTWHACDDPGTASYSPGAISELGDLNGDGDPEYLVTESSAYCYGNSGTAYALVAGKSGNWHTMDSGMGIPIFLEAKGKDGWPDLEVGGTGFCFPVLRWNGKEYALNRHEYEGKACRP